MEESSSLVKVKVEEVEEAHALIVELKQQIRAAETETRNEERAYIDLLTRYNKLKDTGQVLLGRLAEARGVLVRNLYDEFGLELND